jgi:hypothetical protein
LRVRGGSERQKNVRFSEKRSSVLQPKIVAIAIPKIKTRVILFPAGTVADLKEVQLRIEPSQLLAA